MRKKFLLIMLMIASLASISPAQSFMDDKGVLTEVYGGRINIAGGINWGNQYGIRTSLWTNPYFNIGLDGSISQNQNQSKSYYKIHPYIGLHARFFKYLHPYVLGSMGLHRAQHKKYNEPNNYEDYTMETLSHFGATIKVGFASEIKNLRFAVEYGGGSFGTGHEELSASLGYAFKPLPKPNYLENFIFSVGNQTFQPFTGPYEGDKDFPGMEFTVTKEKNGRTVEYNLGMFATDYKFHCGVLNFGKGWRIDNDHKIFDYLTVTPGFQILLWTEGDPDLILPAASLGLGLEYKIWKLVPFVKTRSLLTYSLSNEILFGNTYSYGIGIDF